MRIFLLLSIAFGILLSSCHTPPPSSPLEAAIALRLDSLLLEPEFEAISVGIIDEQDVFSIHRGMLLNGKVPDSNTLYEIASLTKTFTGTLLAEAIREKKIGLDDDIRTYLKGDYPNLVYKDQAITFRHLLTHQSGLPRLFPNKEGLFDNPDWDRLPYEINALQEGFSKEDFFSALSKVRLDTLPGSAFAYSNAGANLLGYLLEEIYDQSYEILLQEKILTPLKMSSTFIDQQKVDMDNMAMGQNVNKVHMPLSAQKGISAEGGIIASTGDMLKYFQFHMEEERETVSISHQHLWEGRYGDFEAGFFWQINKNGENPDIIFQNGGAYGTSSWVTMIPESKLTVFMVSNVSGPEIHQKMSVGVNSIIETIEQSRESKIKRE
ncbi:MAG: serine hydrolase domain-containing protein [Bacteroidota bacterium]